MEHMDLEFIKQASFRTFHKVSDWVTKVIQKGSRIAVETFFTVQNVCQTTYFKLRYPEPEYDMESGKNMALRYRIGMKRYLWVQTPPSPSSKTPSILGATICTRDGMWNFNVRKNLEEILGPCGDFHKQKIKVVDILEYLLTPLEQSLMTHQEWLERGQLSLTIATKSNVWTTLTFDMTETIVFP